MTSFGLVGQNSACSKRRVVALFRMLAAYYLRENAAPCPSLVILDQVHAYRLTYCASCIADTQFLLSTIKTRLKA